jgi:hypothetical protein
MTSDFANVFDKLRKTEQSRATSNSSGGFNNPLIFKPKVGTSCTLRLLWLPADENSDREYPMINSYVHTYWDDNSTSGNKMHTVTCLTSQYLLGETKAGFAKCPICSELSKLYKEYQESGSESAKSLYDTFKRKCFGYVPVYVINGPDEDKGKVKIFQYGKMFKDFFDKKIFGINKPSKDGDESAVISEDDIIGIDAFTYQDTNSGEIMTEAYDLIITTSNKKVPVNGKMVDMPAYDIDFSRKKRNLVEIEGHDLESSEGQDFFSKLNSTLGFDKNYYIKSTEKELQEFKVNYFMKSSVETTVEEAVEAPVKPAIKPPVMKAPPTPEVEEVYDIEEEAPKKPAKASVKAAPKDEVDELPMTASGDLDIDALLGDLQ